MGWKRAAVGNVPSPRNPPEFFPLHALEQARSATEAARRADLPILLAMALEQLAGCALRLDLVLEALTALDEALRSLRSETMYDVQRGRCLVLRAECGLTVLGTKAKENPQVGGNLARTLNPWILAKPE